MTVPWNGQIGTSSRSKGRRLGREYLKEAHRIWSEGDESVSPPSIPRLSGTILAFVGAPCFYRTLLAGGPGIAFMPFAGAFQYPWEKNFTVVQLDQRGAGKTYTSNHQEQFLRRTMNVPQMGQDTLEVVNYLRNRFKREKIFVVGHSWGSLLGLWPAHEHPELIYAYVGTGQVVNMEQNEDLGYHDVLQQAHDGHKELVVKELEGIAPYPPPVVDFEKVSTVRGVGTELARLASHQCGFHGRQKATHRSDLSSRILPFG